MKFATTLQNTILFCCILVACFSCNGQSPQNSSNSIGTAVSALDSNILYIFQDSKKQYWFGSNGQGIFYYDGKKLVQYTTKDGLCHNQIRGIQEDKSGNIFISTASGFVSKFDGKKFSTLMPSPGTWKLQSGDLWFTGAQDSGVVYRYDGQKLHRLQFPKTKTYDDFFASYPRAQFPQMNFNPYDVYSIYKDRRGHLWFGTNIGLCRYDGKHFDWLTEKEIGIDAIALHVRSTIEDSAGKFWFGNLMHRFTIHDPALAKEKGKVSFKEEAGIVDQERHDAAYFMSGIEHNNGYLWTATYSAGVWKYDGKNLTQYEIKDGPKTILLFTIYKDREGNIWLGTHNGGVYRFNGKSFERFKI